MSYAIEAAVDAFRASTFNALTRDECRDAVRAALTAYHAAPEAKPAQVGVNWRGAIKRVRDQLGQAGGIGTAGAQNSITEREIGGWVLDAVEDEMTALAALTPGYVLVPLEPTEEMLAAGMDSLAESTGEPLSFIVRDVLFAYRAMVAKVRP